MYFKKIARYFKLKRKPLYGAKLKNVLRHRPHSERCFRCQPVTEYHGPFHMLSTVLFRLLAMGKSMCIQNVFWTSLSVGNFPLLIYASVV